MDKEKEAEIAEFWKKRSIYQKAKKASSKNRKFYFLDGPPYATGYIHIGTAWNKILKDAYIRFWRMNGFSVWDQPGYDTHGLPIENKVEKQLQLKSKADIERLGIEKFVVECRNYATKFIGTMNKQFENLGVWMDWDNPYVTLSNEYIEGAWHTFKTAYDKGFLYKGLYPVHVCSHCVDPNSTIIVDGGTRKIKELKNCWKHNKILSIDISSKQMTITNPLGYMEHEDDAFLITTKIGKKLIASGDHPFWTQRGWIPLSKLRRGTKVAVYNSTDSPLPKITEKGRILLDENNIKSTLEDLENLIEKSNVSTYNDLSSKSRIDVKNYVYELRNKGYSYTQIIKDVKNKFGIKISKSWVAKILKVITTTRYDTITKELKEKGFLPVYSKSTKSFILARLVGHIFGDGSITITTSKNRMFPVFNIVFTGKEDDLKEIQKDLDTLGYGYSDISTVRCISTVNGRMIDGYATSMRCSSLSLIILLISLGCPVGRKSNHNTHVPVWVKSNKKLAREFLASYFGSELDIIKHRKSEKGFEVLRLHLTKDRTLEKNGVEFAKEICRLINKFGITTGQVKIDRKTVNGKRKSKITLSIDCNDDNLIKFSELIGYEYCKERKAISSHVLGYLLYKKRVMREYQKLKNKILVLRQSKMPVSKIATMLNIQELYARHVVYGKSKSTRAANYILSFNKWLKSAAKDLKDGIIWDEIEDIKPVEKRSVCDIAVENHHNFITNGFLTHNCETAVSYNEVVYSNVTDPSVYVKFKAVSDSGMPEYFVIWTTTPWTLPANTGVMAKPDADYVKVAVGDEVWILAKDPLDQLMKKIGVVDYKILETLKGRDLKDVRYDHPLKDVFGFQKGLKNAHRVVLSDQFVTLDTGTGLVHTAPGHGQEDYKVGVENGLPIVSPINMNGTFNDECGEFSGVFVKSADRMVIDRLKGRGLLVLEEKVTHEYPQCWRCNSPLLQISVPQWFFRVTKIREKLISENRKVKWYPQWAGQRFENWLENLGDWPISRQRYWGIPLPIWVCDACNFIKVIGSPKELKAEVKDLHRPYIDKITMKCKCGNEMKRIQDVLDVWFDAGLASWSSLGYPANKALFKKMWPANLNIEGPDQIRGWWNAELITSVILFEKAPFKNILFHGFVLDAHGVKMAKSVGNIVAPEEVIEKYGRDVLRFYFLMSPPWDDFYLKWTDIDAVAKSFSVIENTFNFVKSYCHKTKKPSRLNIEDRWILSRLNSLIETSGKNARSYSMHKNAVNVQEFIINDFSRWYIKLIRDRVWPSYSKKDKDAAFYALHEVTKALSLLMAPITPFIAEYVHQSVLRGLGEKSESVHLCQWPKARKNLIDKSLEAEMDMAREISEAVNSIRKNNNLKQRWPIEKVIIESNDATVKKTVKKFRSVLLFATNAKAVETGLGEEGFASKGFSKGVVYVSKAVLKDEALLRELLREIQSERKKRKLVVSNKIVLFLDNSAMEKFSAEIKEKVGAREIRFGHVDGEFGYVKMDDSVVKFKFSLVKQ